MASSLLLRSFIPKTISDVVPNSAIIKRAAATASKKPPEVTKGGGQKTNKGGKQKINNGDAAAPSAPVIDGNSSNESFSADKKGANVGAGGKAVVGDTSKKNSEAANNK